MRPLLMIFEIMLNYTHECLNDMSSIVLLPFRQTGVHRSWIKITTLNTSNVNAQDCFLDAVLHYITELCVFDKAGQLWSPKGSHLIYANRGSCSISNCIKGRERGQRRGERGTRGKRGESEREMTPSASFSITVLKLVLLFEMTWK